MPELPEIALATRVARAATRDRTITQVEVLHPAQRRQLPAARADALIGDRVVRVRRRAKYQLLELASGRSLLVHFRLAGDWVVGATAAGAPRHSRVVFHFDDGSALALTDPRALCAVVLSEAGIDPLPPLGPEATVASFSPAYLQRSLGARGGAIKPLLLDQRLVAGVGNIYASEALWYARVDPRCAGRRLDLARCRCIVDGVKRAMRKALRVPARYYQDGVEHLRFNVYDREGRGCRRCRTPIRRIVQGARSTYFCPACQR